MLLAARITEDSALDYKFGEITLKAGEEYVLQDMWIQNLPCEKSPAIVKPYDIGIGANGKSILFIRAMGMGDMLFMSPLINMIKETYPDCKIGFATVPAQQQVLEIIPGIDEIVDYPIKKEKYNEYDYQFTVEGLIEGNRNNENRNIYEVFFEHLKVNNVDLNRCRPIIKENIYKNVEMDDNLVIIHPFAVDPMRQMNLYITSYLCDLLYKAGYKVLLISDKFEKEQYSGLFKSNHVSWSVDMNPDMMITARTVASARCVFSCDSVITHLAQAVGTRTICLYGPFPADTRVQAYKNITVIDTNPECRCSEHQLGKCRLGFQIPPCMTVDPETIVNLISGKPMKLEPIIGEPFITEFNMENVDETFEKEGIISKAIR